MAKRGGVRPGAGRKPAAIEDNVKAHIKSALNEEDLRKIWQNVVKLSKEGSEKHIQLLFNYYYGKPKDNEGNPTEMIIRVQRRS